MMEKSGILKLHMVMVTSCLMDQGMMDSLKLIANIAVKDSGVMTPIFSNPNSGNTYVMKIEFEGKAGIFGQHGWKKIPWWKYLSLFSDHVTRIRITYKGNQYLIGRYSK